MSDEGQDEKEYRRWLKPPDALIWLKREGFSTEVAKEAILRRLGNGGLSASAYRSIWDSNPFGDEHVEDFPRVPIRLWSTITATGTLWSTGEVKFPRRAVKGASIQIFDGPITFVSVRFDPLGIEMLVESESRAASNPATNQPRRGPKPKAFWAPMIAEIEASISSGQLLASNLADVERHMHAWLSAHDEDAGESTVRNYARRLLQKLPQGQ